MMDFIAKKVVARSIVASIVPLTIYSAAYALSKFTPMPTFEFLNVYALVVLSITSFVYPFNVIGLAMFFTPLDVLWERLIISARDAQGKDKKPNPVLIQNFGPIKRQQNYRVANITHGKVPTDINGIYLRNGPDAKYIPENKSHHWFDGDAMIHALRIKDGELYYCNRWLESERYKMECEAD
jgi:hypothetical protein